MTTKINQPPAGKSWVWVTQELIASDAWRSRGINAIRLVDFLLIEQMRHGGRQNGKLKAPQAQLIDFGIGSRYVADAILEVERLGLVDCHRGGMRVATTYTLTWLPLHDRTAQSDRWRAFRNYDLRPLPVPKSKNLPLNGKAALPLKGKADDTNLPDKGKADRPKTLPLKGKVLLREVLSTEAAVISGRDRPAAAAGGEAAAAQRGARAGKPASLERDLLLGKTGTGG